MFTLVDVSVICWLFEAIKSTIVILCDYLVYWKLYANHPIKSRSYGLTSYLVLNILHKLFPFHNAVIIHIYFSKEAYCSMYQLNSFIFFAV